MSKLETERDFITEIVKGRGYVDFDITFTGGTEQKNYFGSVLRATVDGFKNGVRAKEELFLKTHSDSPERNQRVKIEDKFKREALMYNGVIDQYKKLQVKIDFEERIKFVECLHADDRYLVLENLKDYKSIDDTTVLDLEHMIIMMEDLGKFHALSFALQHKKPQQFFEFKKKIQRPNIACEVRRKVIIGKVWDWTMECLENDGLKNKLLERQEVLLSEYKEVEDSKYFVICHGDYNFRNVLFKYDSNSKPECMKMIDFQMSYVTSPIADIIFAVFSSTDSNLRRKHLELLLNHYYKSLTKFLSLLDCDANVCYPMDTFKKDFSKYLPCEFATILVVLRLMCLAFKDENKPMKKSSTILEYNSDESESVFKEKVNEVIGDLFHFGYL